MWLAAIGSRIGLALALTGALACWIPARRASRVDAMVALRASDRCAATRVIHSREALSTGVRSSELVARLLAARRIYRSDHSELTFWALSKRAGDFPRYRASAAARPRVEYMGHDRSLARVPNGRGPRRLCPLSSRPTAGSLHRGQATWQSGRRRASGTRVRLPHGRSFHCSYRRKDVEFLSSRRKTQL